jgi:hypothetical protein
MFQIPPQLQFESQKSTSSASKTNTGSYLTQALQLVKLAQAIDPKYSYIINSLENAIQGKATTLEHKVDQLLELAKTSTPSPPLYSTMAKKDINASSKTTAAASQPQQKPKTPEPEDRKLVLQIPDHKKESLKIDSFDIRNQINKALRATVVAIVTKSVKGNVVLTTTKDYSANYLLEKTAVWQHVFHGMEVKSAEKPTTWIKVVAHGVPASPFADLSLLKDECSTFNPVKVIGNPMWLTTPEKRNEKRAGSVVISVSTEAERKHCLKEGLIIAGERVRVVNYKAYSPKTQCYRCQGYSHNVTTRPNRWMRKTNRWMRTDEPLDAQDKPLDAQAEPLGAQADPLDAQADPRHAQTDTGREAQGASGPQAVGKASVGYKIERTICPSSQGGTWQASVNDTLDPYTCYSILR